jgi:hypothetical protein
MKVISSFRTMLQEIPPRLANLPSDAVSRRKSPADWSPKQELGHLLDSAIMNHQRLLRVLAKNNPTLPPYDGVFCVEAHDYHARSWPELIATWKTLNQHFLWLIERVTYDQWTRPCLSEGKAVTLEFLVGDYIQHALHHLQHIGVAIGDLGDEMKASA